jgi:hypothetical protein
MAALLAESERRIAQADAALKSTGRPLPGVAAPNRVAPTTSNEHFRGAWSTAMADVADKMTAGIDNLPESERKAAGIRAAALKSTANHLIGGAPSRQP